MHSICSWGQGNIWQLGACTLYSSAGKKPLLPSAKEPFSLKKSNATRPKRLSEDVIKPFSALHAIAKDFTQLVDKSDKDQKSRCIEVWWFRWSANMLGGSIYARFRKTSLQKRMLKSRSISTMLWSINIGFSRLESTKLQRLTMQ